MQFNDYILSFNINTNHWCAEYIYKRLKFLGSKMYSQIMTLLFLALWHGFHSGYYHCFFMEFVVLYFERDVSITQNLLTQNFARFFKIRLLLYCLILIFYVIYFSQIGPVLKNSEIVQTTLKIRWEARVLAWIFLKLYTFVFMGYSLVSFVLLSYPRYNQVYASMYYCGHVFFLSYPLLAPYIKRLLLQRQRSHQE